MPLLVIVRRGQHPAITVGRQEYVQIQIGAKGRDDFLDALGVTQQQEALYRALNGMEPHTHLLQQTFFHVLQHKMAAGQVGHRGNRQKKRGYQARKDDAQRASTHDGAHRRGIRPP